MLTRKELSTQAVLDEVSWCEGILEYQGYIVRKRGLDCAIEVDIYYHIKNWQHVAKAEYQVEDDLSTGRSNIKRDSLNAELETEFLRTSWNTKAYQKIHA